MTTPQELDLLIRKLQDGELIIPTNSNEETTIELVKFAQSLKLDEAFDEGLTQQLHQVISSKHSGQSVKFMRRLSTIAASMMLALALVLALPPLRTIAQDLLAQLFPRTDQEEISITYNDYDDMETTFTTIEGLEAAVSFDLLEPNILPSNVTESVFVYNSARNVSTQWYITPFRQFGISQQPLESIQSGLLAFTFDLQLPDSVDTQAVELGSVIGELVEGMWVESEDDETFVWSDNFWYFSLRWQDATNIYEITLMPRGGNPSREDLKQEIIAFAQQMTQ